MKPSLHSLQLWFISSPCSKQDLQLWKQLIVTSEVVSDWYIIFFSVLGTSVVFNAVEGSSVAFKAVEGSSVVFKAVEGIFSVI